jgi:hypothetical protein
MERSSNNVVLGIGTGALALPCGVGKNRCQNSAGTSSFHVVRRCFCFNNISNVLRKGLHCVCEVWWEADSSYGEMGSITVLCGEIK